MNSKSKISNFSDVIRVFEQNVINHPNKVAVVYQNVFLTYIELNKMVNQSSRFILNLTKNNFSTNIGICGSNKLNMLVLQLATLKINCNFVPLDIDNPTKRIEHMINSVNLSLIINCDDKNLGEDYISIFTKKDIKLINFYNYKNKINSLDTSNLNLSIESKQPAYILFTSGSTSSKPKGVIQSQYGIIQQVDNYTNDLSLNSNDHFLQLANFAHDQYILDCFTALLIGASLYLYNSDNLTISILQNFIKEMDISVFSSIPSLYEMVFSNLPVSLTFPNLRIITTGGEETKVRHAKLFQKLCRQGVLNFENSFFWNGYGATECSWISGYQITADTDLTNMQTLPLGTISSNINYSIVNPGNIYPDGQGELCISATGLAQGYIGDIKANSAFSFLNGERYYHTGDIVSVIDNKILQFEGRSKSHSKINGKRINLHEIEVAIAESINCIEVAVFILGEDPYKKIIACIEVKIVDNAQEISLKKN